MIKAENVTNKAGFISAYIIFFSILYIPLTKFSIIPKILNYFIYLASIIVVYFVYKIIKLAINRYPTNKHNTIENGNGLLKSYIKGFQHFGLKVNLVVTSLALTIVYFIGIGPYSIISKTLKKDLLEIKGGKVTYWKDKKITKRKLEEYMRTF